MTGCGCCLTDGCTATQGRQLSRACPGHQHCLSILPLVCKLPLLALCRGPELVRPHALSGVIVKAHMSAVGGRDRVSGRQPPHHSPPTTHHPPPTTHHPPPTTHHPPPTTHHPPPTTHHPPSKHEPSNSNHQPCNHQPSNHQPSNHQPVVLLLLSCSCLPLLLLPVAASAASPLFLLLPELL